MDYSVPTQASKYFTIKGTDHDFSNPGVSTTQGFNARKVISGVYASFVLQCTVTGW